MKILFDQGTPVPLHKHLAGHTVDSAFKRGWAEIKNSQLLTQAEGAGFELLTTTDQNLKYQQNLQTRKIAILVLSTTSWRRLMPHANSISEMISRMHAGDYKEFRI